MFLENKYTKWYYSIITHAKARVNFDKIYTEKHHILPKSMGGDNSAENIIALTGKEHFICHLLLTKMTEGNFKKKMIFAFFLMSGSNKRKNGKSREYRKLNSKQYQKLRNEFKHNISESRKGVSIFSKTPEATAAKRSAKLKNRIFSEDTKKQMSLSAKNRNPESRFGVKISNTENMKRPKSKEHREKLSIPKTRACCVFCYAEGSVGAIKRFHTTCC